jgi:hypothetical protein
VPSSSFSSAHDLGPGHLQPVVHGDLLHPADEPEQALGRVTIRGTDRILEE